jgi:hydroxylamine reductase
MPPRKSYADNIFTTAVVAYPGLKHIAADASGHKDFTPVIERAKELGGWHHAKSFHGINGGKTMTTGFGHQAVLGAADTVINAVKAGDLKHIYLVGGCDGALHGRNYFTRFVEKTAPDTLVLTLACGKFRFNDMDLGTRGGLPRILDMGQCNDAYSAVKVASALADAFGVGINDLPLTLVLSWYEQKAVCVLLSLLSLGVKNIYLPDAARIRRARGVRRPGEPVRAASDHQPGQRPGGHRRLRRPGVRGSGGFRALARREPRR